jgi:hypothetical protein
VKQALEGSIGHNSANRKVNSKLISKEIDYNLVNKLNGLLLFLFGTVFLL